MPTTVESLVLYAAPGAPAGQVEELAAHLNIPVVAAAPEELHLRMDAAGLALTDGSMELRGDFTRMLPRLKENNLRQEYIVKAAKQKGREGEAFAVDATAGLGEDSLLLAAAGYRVCLYEYDPIIAALLRDALRRAAELPELAEIAARMELHEENSIAALPALDCTPDVVVLDPMFPERTKSASVKKKFQLLQQLERPCDLETELLQAALAAKPKKIIIKRPVKGPYLAGIKPSYSLTGKAIRYDCILPL